MTSRERVRLAMAHRQTDRVPMDLWGSSCRLHTALYKKIVDTVGFQNYEERLRPGKTTEYVDYRLSDLVGADFRHIDIGKPDNFEPRIDASGIIYDEWGIGHRRLGSFDEAVVFPLEEIELDVLNKHNWPNPVNPGRIRGLREKAQYWFEKTQYAITATTAVSGLFFEMGQYLCGTENFLVAMYSNQKFVDALMDKLTELFIEWNCYYLDPIAEFLEWVEFTEDIGTQHSLLISPQMVKRFLREPHLQLFKVIRTRYPKLKIFYHSCGAVSDIIPEILSWGVDILNPLQPLATGMNLERIKREYGDQVVFHGGIDIQQAMCGSKSDVEREVETRIDQLGTNGGYILAPCNHLMIDVPVENFLHLYEYAQLYSKRR